MELKFTDYDFLLANHADFRKRIIDNYLIQDQSQPIPCKPIYRGGIKGWISRNCQELTMDQAAGVISHQFDLTLVEAKDLAEAVLK